MTIPAVCERCGQWFTNPGLALAGPGLTVTSEGAMINHPGCGGYGVIPAGEYQFTEAGVNAILAASLPTHDIEQLMGLLSEAHGAATYEDMVAVVERAPATVRTALAGLLPADLATAQNYILILLTALALVIGAMTLEAAQDAGSAAHRDAQVAHSDAEVADNDAKLAHTDAERAHLDAAATREIVLRAIEQIEGDSIRGRRVTTKVGRNDLCPCGSGQKFKRCCGK